jgi:hypothetical protein
MKSSHSIFAVCAFSVCVATFCSPLHATVILVPSQYPTIQQGLNAAGTGDTVFVAPGTYPENISWPNVDGILLTSEFGTDSTTIDGGVAGRVIDFPNMAFSNATEITGFTIQNGYAVQGGGIYIYQGSPYIHGNVIRWNIAEGTSTWVYGGGIFCNGVGRPQIEYNLFQGNAAKGQYWNYGGAIYIDNSNSALILGNTIEYDSTVGGSWNYGAGIYCRGGASPDIMHNVIRENICTQGSRGHGAGIYVGTDCTAYILSNLIYNNRTQSGSWNYGGGLLINSGAHVINNTIVGNSCIGGSWRYGGGINVYDSTNTIENNIIANNSAGNGGGIYVGSGDHATLLYNDVWNNSGGNYSGISPGPNDISVDPLFVTGPLGDYYLSQIAAGQGQDSPCLDYGSCTAQSLGLDIYTTRTDTVPDSAIVDLGFHYPTGYPAAVEESKQVPAKVSISTSPSPVHTSCRIELCLKHSEHIALYIYDGSGRLQMQIFEGYLKAGIHSWNWTGNSKCGSELPSGSYFLILRINGREPRTSKITLMR